MKWKTENLNYYRCGVVVFIKRDFFLCYNENLSGREGCYVFEVFFDVFGGFF